MFPNIPFYFALITFPSSYCYAPYVQLMSIFNLSFSFLSVTPASLKNLFYSQNASNFANSLRNLSLDLSTVLMMSSLGSLSSHTQISINYSIFSSVKNTAAYPSFLNLSLKFTLPKDSFSSYVRSFIIAAKCKQEGTLSLRMFYVYCFTIYEF